MTQIPALLSTPPRPIMPRSRTQRDAVGDHLRSGRSLSPVEAFALYGTMRLAARVYELREAIPILAAMRVDPNGRTYARYVLAKKGMRVIESSVVDAVRGYRRQGTVVGLMDNYVRVQWDDASVTINGLYHTADLLLLPSPNQD